MLKTLLATVLFLLSSSAWAQSAQDVRRLINSGHYTEAQTQAENLNTAEGYALAAESLAAQILLGDVSKLNRRAKEAHALSQKALSLNPDLYEAKLQYALTDGFVTRTTGDITAWRKKMPMKTFEKIKSFRADYPDDALGMALEGAWHMGVVRKTGDKNGKKWFGASLSEGLRLYDSARRISPNDVLVETNYAMSLLVLNVDHYGPYMRPVLENVSSLDTITHLDRKVQARAVDVLTHYDDTKRVKKLAGRFLDGK